MEVARTIARRSLCSRDQVGAVIVSRDNRIVDTGYNGPPSGYVIPAVGCGAGWCRRGARVSELSISYDDCVSLHAEQNALMFSDRRLREGGTIYVSSGVCGVCAKLIANSGLETVVYAKPAPHRFTSQWVDFMERCGLTVVEYDAS